MGSPSPALPKKKKVRVVPCNPIVQRSVSKNLFFAFKTYPCIYFLLIAIDRLCHAWI